jgi:hypothetical protein
MTRHEAPEAPQDAQEGAERPFSYSSPVMPVETPTSATAPASVADSASVRERLAEYAHEAWSGWMDYQFRWGGSVMTVTVEGVPLVCWVMSQASYQRWQRQMLTPYRALPESEKASDRAEADRILEICDP